MQSWNIDESKKFFRTFAAESDRACGVLGAELLSNNLLELLAALAATKIPEDVSSGTAVLSSFSSRITMAHLFGLVSDEEQRDLHLIRKIRNQFAHRIDAGLSFTSREIESRCNELDLPKILFEDKKVKMGIDTPRQRFQIGVGILHHLITTMRFDQVTKRISPQTISSIARSK